MSESYSEQQDIEKGLESRKKLPRRKFLTIAAAAAAIALATSRIAKGQTGPSARAPEPPPKVESEKSERFGDLTIQEIKVQGSPIVSTEGYYGGAISSIIVNGVNVVDRSDTGRLAQIAFNDSWWIPEFFNPTQGGASPAHGGSTREREGTVKSLVLEAGVSASGRTSYTKNKPAYWDPIDPKDFGDGTLDSRLYPGYIEQWAEINPTDKTGKKHVGVIRTKSVIDMPVIPGTKFATRNGGLAMELPTIYTDPTLTKMYWLEVNKLTPVPELDGEKSVSVAKGDSNYSSPCIASNKDGTVAIGQIRLAIKPPLINGQVHHAPHEYYSITRYPNNQGRVGKLDIVWNQDAISASANPDEIATLIPEGPLHVEYETYIVTGTLVEVAERMRELQKLSSETGFGAWEKIDVKNPSPYETPPNFTKAFLPNVLSNATSIPLK